MNHPVSDGTLRNSPERSLEEFGRVRGHRSLPLRHKIWRTVWGSPELGNFHFSKGKTEKELSNGGLGEGKEVDSKGYTEILENLFVQHLWISKNPNSKA